MLDLELLISAFKILLLAFFGIIKAWWWLPLPIVLFFPLKFLYLWYIQDKWGEKIEWIMLEIKIPKEIERPMKAMEQVMSYLWMFYDPADFKEKWIEGKYLLAISFEIASIDGVVHFFLRVPKKMQEFFETAIYSQYPEVEISEVEDYTKKVPQNIPNKDWDLWGCDYELLKPQCYPIKTYKSFFEPTQEIKEEKRVDPLADLIEGMSRLKKGEQMWFQIRAKPITNKEIPWVDEGKRIIDKIVGRPSPPKPKSITAEAIRTLITGQPPFGGAEKAEEKIPALTLTDTEKEVISAIDHKIGKQGFETNIRFIYLGKKDVFFKPHLRLGLKLGAGLSTQDLNGLKPWNVTKVTPPALFRKKRVYLKQRRVFRKYVNRYPPLYPREGGTFVLNTEELATLWHFPSRMGAPTPAFPRIEAKKGGPPPSIPTE
jgi:hypothetical protein